MGELLLIEYRPRLISWLAPYRWARYQENLIRIKHIEHLEKQLVPPEHA